MEKLVFITGQLVMEIRTRQLQAEGSRRLIGGTSIVPGGRSYRQARFAKELGYSVILLGRLGDDYYGRTILQSLSSLGIGTQFIEISRSEYTGLSFEVDGGAGSPPLAYFDPGASVGAGDFRLPIRSYLPLCDIALINQWFHPDLSGKILRQAEKSSIPTVYVCSMPPREAPPHGVDYLFLDLSERAAGDGEGDVRQAGALQVRRGTLVWSGGRLRAVNPAGREILRLELDPRRNGDDIVTRLMASIIQGTELGEMALQAGRAPEGG